MTNRNLNEAPTPASINQGSGAEASPAPDLPNRATKTEEHPAQLPIPEPVSAAQNPALGGRPDSPAEAEGRRILSTAFVRVGPDGYLTVELHDGRVLVLRDVVMRRRDYCGTRMPGGEKGAQYCGGYADVASARPGGGPSTQEPVSEAAGSPRPGSN
jgi:hypothetical protein